MLPDLLPTGSKKMTVAFNTVSQLIGKGISGGATFLISIILAHAYGARGFGDFTIITTFVAVFYLFADFGLNAVFLQDDLEQSAAWQILIAARLLISIVSIVLALSILSFLPVGIDRGYTSVIKLGIILYSPTIFLQALINSANAVFQQKFRYDLSTLAVVAGSLVSLGLVWLTTQLFLPGVAVTASVVAMAVGLFVTAMLAVYLAGKYSSWIFAFDWPKVRNFLWRSLPLGLTLIFNVIYFRADSFILTLTRPVTEVGLYGFAYKLFEFVLVIPTFFMNSVYPFMVLKVNHEAGIMNHELANLGKKSFLFLLPASIFTLLVMWFLAPFITWIRPEFSGSVEAVRILALGIPFFFLTSLTMWILITLKRQKLLAFIYAFSMLVNIGLNLVFIPAHGFLAAAWTTVISEGIVLLLTVIAIRFRPHQHIT